MPLLVILLNNYMKKERIIYPEMKKSKSKFSFFIDIIHFFFLKTMCYSSKENLFSHENLLDQIWLMVLAWCKGPFLQNLGKLGKR